MSQIKIRFTAEHVLMELPGALAEAAQEPMIQWGLEVEAYAKNSMKHGGRRRIRPTRGKNKGRLVMRGVPSKPGTPPHAQTGEGRASIQTAVARLQGSRRRIVVFVGPTGAAAEYMWVHEKGGKYHPPRPFMYPAMRATAPRYRSFFTKLPLARTKTGRKMERAIKRWKQKYGRRRD